MKPISQFRIPCHFLQHKSGDLRASETPNDYIIVNKKPGPNDPGNQDELCGNSLPHSYVSTETKFLSTLPNKKPDLGRPGLDSYVVLIAPPIIAHPELNASGTLLCAETAMGYSPSGFIKIPRSLFSHPGWQQALSKHKSIFLELINRSAWAPTSFYWNGIKYEVSPGQLYFSPRKLAIDLSQIYNPREKITYAEIRGALRYFEKCGMLAIGKNTGKKSDSAAICQNLTQDLTQDLTQPITMITILYSKFCDDPNFMPNAGSNARANVDLTQTSRTKEEVKEHKEEKKKNKSTRRAAPVDNAEALRLCSNFAALLSKTLPGIKLPSSLVKWETEFDLMLRIDGRSVKDIEFLFAKMPGHWYSKNVQSAAKFREKFAVLMAHHTEQQSNGDASVNRSWFLESKRDYPKELRNWTASGDWVLNSRNSKEISLKMGHAEFKQAFLSACGGKENA